MMGGELGGVVLRSKEGMGWMGRWDMLFELLVGVVVSMNACDEDLDWLEYILCLKI